MTEVRIAEIIQKRIENPLMDEFTRKEVLFLGFLQNEDILFPDDVQTARQEKHQEYIHYWKDGEYGFTYHEQLNILHASSLYKSLRNQKENRVAIPRRTRELRRLKQDTLHGHSDDNLEHEEKKT